MAEETMKTPNPPMPPEDPTKVENRVMAPEARAENANLVSPQIEDTTGKGESVS